MYRSVTPRSVSSGVPARSSTPLQAARASYGGTQPARQASGRSNSAAATPCEEFAPQTEEELQRNRFSLFAKVRRRNTPAAANRAPLPPLSWADLTVKRRAASAPAAVCQAWDLKTQYDVLQDLDLPVFVLVGLQSAGKSSLIESYLNFPFNVVRANVGTRAPLRLSLVCDPLAKTPQCRVNETDVAYQACAAELTPRALSKTGRHSVERRTPALLAAQELWRAIDKQNQRVGEESPTGFRAPTRPPARTAVRPRRPPHTCERNHVKGPSASINSVLLVASAVLCMQSAHPR